MRISIPTISNTPFSNAQAISSAAGIERLSSFLNAKRSAVLTGAGVSVDSGIRAYRGKDGRYMNPNYRPIFYHELVEQSPKGYAFRQRYWSRSYLGYPPVRDALPNPNHFSLAALQYSGHAPDIITQNVDGLHHKASPWDTAPHDSKDILELHGTLFRVKCAKDHVIPRDTFQDMISALNPLWKQVSDDILSGVAAFRTNPDGDIELEEGMSYETFLVPECPQCVSAGIRDTILKPEVVFFGESIPDWVKKRSFDLVEETDQLLVVGTTLATYSAFRLVKRALELKKPVMVLNVGPTRADGIPGVEKLEISTSLILREAVQSLISSRESDNVTHRLLTSGVIRQPEDNWWANQPTPATNPTREN